MEYSTLEDASKRAPESQLSAKRVHVPRQLGDWISVRIDSTTKKVSCICEDYNRDQFCVHAALFEVIQFDNRPHLGLIKSTENWVGIRKKAIALIKDLDKISK